MSFIFQLSLIFCVLILFHYINLYYYFQINKYFNKTSEVYNLSFDLIKSNELIWQNVQTVNILIFIAIGVIFDYFNNPPDFLLNINNWICLLIVLIEIRNIIIVDDFIQHRNKIDLE